MDADLRFSRPLMTMADAGRHLSIPRQTFIAGHGVTFGREYVLVSPALGTDGISVLWDFSRTDAGAGLIEGSTGQVVIREIVQDYLRYVGFAADDYPNRLELKPFEPTKVIPGVVAEEHGVGIDHVRAAARVLLGRAS